MPGLMGLPARRPMNGWSTGLLAAVLGVLLSVAGCGTGGSEPGPPSPVPATPAASPDAVTTLLSTCSADAQGWQVVPVDGVAAAATGSGPATVVLLNDSGNSACGWLPLADALVERQLKVVIFAYRSTTADNEPEAVRDALAVADRARSGSRYILMGASLGGRVVIESAATRSSGLAGIVSLSGERTIQDYRDILPDARKVTSPALYVGAKDDFATRGERQQRQLHEAMRGRPNILLQRDGVAHGMDLINPDGPDGKAVNSRILAFVEQQLQS
jgi:dienelactone hydrolase